jgi:tetratricopeptide (TPR) repeat protein
MKKKPVPEARAPNGRRTLRVAQALDVVALLADHDPLRAALISASFDDPDLGWTELELYRTVATRLLDVEALDEEIPRIIAADAARRERVWRQTAAALRALSEGDPEAAARAVVTGGEIEEEAGRLDAAERLYKRAMELGRRPRDRRAEGLALRRLGRIAKARGDLPVAIQRYRQGYEIAEAQRDAEGMVVGCQGLGNCYVDEGRWDDAEQWYRRGLELVGGRGIRDQWLEINLSIVARRAGRLEESEGWLATARETVAASGDREAAVYLANAEGLLRVAQDRHDEAESIYRSAIDDAGAPAAQATILVNLAECLLFQRRIGESVEVARELEGVVIAHQLHPFLVYVYMALGAAARAANDPEALVFYEQALELARVGGNAAERAQVQREYAILERAQGAPESAAARLREAEDIFRQCGSRVELEATLRELESLDIPGA